MTEKALIVGIGGPSSSGKTSIAKILHRIIPDSILLHQDDFYKNDKDIPRNEEVGEADWDCPEAINFDAFKKELAYIRSHCKLSPETESYENRYNSDTKDSGEVGLPQDEIERLSSSFRKALSQRNLKLILIDGFMLYHDPDIIKLFDVKIFLRASYKTLKHRRENRAGYQTQETFWVDPPGYFEKLVYPGYARSHKHLFKDENVEDELDSSKISKMGIHSFSNNEGCSLHEVFTWASDCLLREIESI